MNLCTKIISLQNGIVCVLHRAVFEVHGHLAVVGDDDVLGVVHNRVLLGDLRRTEGLFDFPVYCVLCIEIVYCVCVRNA